MKQIKFLMSVVGNEFSYQIGEVYEIDNETAAKWIKIGFVVTLKMETKTDKKPLEKAVKRPPIKRVKNVKKNK